MLYRIMAAAFLCLLASPSFAASKCFISEYGVLTATNTGGVPAQIAAEPSITVQTPVDFSGGAANSAAFSGGTKYIRLACDTRAAFRFRSACSGSAATTSSPPIGVDSPEYFGVQPGDCVSIIASP